MPVCAIAPDSPPPPCLPSTPTRRQVAESVEFPTRCSASSQTLGLFLSPVWPLLRVTGRCSERLQRTPRSDLRTTLRRKGAGPGGGHTRGPRARGRRTVTSAAGVAAVRGSAGAGRLEDRSAAMPRIWAVLPLAFAFVVRSPSSVHTHDTYSTLEGLKLRRNVRDTETQCSEGLYRGGQFCCLPCQPGERKSSDCTSSGGKPTCLPCKEGEEYTDKEHYSSTCRRCRLCDGGHGLEVETNCTRTRNTKCRCKSNFYCDTSGCEHCERCTTCEHGILEQCTSTSNTKCKQKSSWYHLMWLLIIPCAVISLGLIFIKYKRRNHGHHESLTLHSERMPMNDSDVDLGKYIINIAEEMTINQVKKFVRKNGLNEAKIDDIKNDNLQDTAEQKVQLLRDWYQAHGKKDAYNTLIKGLRKAGLCALAEKIQDIVHTDMRNSTLNVRNENERQSLTLNEFSSD